MSKAINAVNADNLARIKEEIELMVAELQMEYYTSNDMQVKYATVNEYVKARIEGKEGGMLTTSSGVEIEMEDGFVLYNGAQIGKLKEDGSIDMGDLVIENGNLVAKYKVTYDANGGENAPVDNARYENGNDVNIDFSTIPIREQYQFLGWSTTPNATSAQYAENGTKSFVMQNKNVTLYAVWKRTLTIGDTVFYNPNGTYNWQAEYYSSSNMDVDRQLSSAEGQDYNIKKWKVLSVKEDVIELVPENPTSGKVTLQGAQGYNNAVKLLNDACSNLYGNARKGIEARSIKIEDIESRMTEEALTEVHSFCANEVVYGNQYVSAYSQQYSYFPVIYKQEANRVIDGVKATNGLGVSEQISLVSKSDDGAVEGYLQANVGIQPFMSYWSKKNEFLLTAFAKNIDYNLLIEHNSYWIASRSVTVHPAVCAFQVYCLNQEEIKWGATRHSSLGYSHLGNEFGIFPIISLNVSLINNWTGTQWIIE